jgi:hypothetical protein
MLTSKSRLPPHNNIKVKAEEAKEAGDRIK